MSFRGKEKMTFEEDKVSVYTPKRPSIQLSSFKRNVLIILITIWLFTINYFERVVPYKAIKSCRWDSWELWPNGIIPHRVAVIADPQIVDDNTYPNQTTILNQYIRRISDNYLKRNHKYMNSILDPDTTVFLGDLFDGGREWDDDKWFDEYKRFTNLYPQLQNRRTYMNLPGNHDIGFQTVDKKVVKRFEAFFGKANQAIELGNHTLVIVDTISLSHPDPEINADAKAFLANLNDMLEFPENPRILFTHVPLYRFTDQQPCGPLREKKGRFPVMKGYQYQTVIEYEISQHLLTAVDPDLVLSGDDHDYCDVKHNYKKNGHTDRIAREILVKTASMTCGVKYPAIQLLSLYRKYDPLHKTVKEDNNHFQTKMCYLPAPYTAIYTYVILYILSIVVFATLYLKPSSLIRWAKFPSKKDDTPFEVDKRDTVMGSFKQFLVQNIRLDSSVRTFVVNIALLTVSVHIIFLFYGKTV